MWSHLEENVSLWNLLCQFIFYAETPEEKEKKERKKEDKKDL